MTWDEWIDRNRGNLTKHKTKFEMRFAREILRRVPGLDPDSVFTQTRYFDLSGNPRYIDFTIQEGDRIRIAIEIDGWDKRGRNEGQTREEFTDWSFRELSMTADGWVPLRVANDLIRSETVAVLRAVTLELQRQRRYIKDLSTSQRKAEVADQRALALKAAVDDAKSGHREALRVIQEERRQRDLTYLSVAERTEFERIREENERELAESRKENRGMKVMGVAIVGVVALALVAIFVLKESGGGEASACEQATPADQLSAASEGEVVTASGTVAGITRIDGSSPRIYVNIGGDYPDQELTAVIWGEDSNNWQIPPEAKYDNREVAVTGALETYEGALQIDANSPNDIVICS